VPVDTPPAAFGWTLRSAGGRVIGIPTDDDGGSRDSRMPMAGSMRPL